MIVRINKSASQICAFVVSFLVVLVSFNASIQAAPLLQRNADSSNSTVNSTTTGGSETGNIQSFNYELLQRVNALEEEIQRLRGMIEEQNYTIQQMKSAERDRYADIDFRLNALKSAQPAVQAGTVVADPTLTGAMDEDTKTYQSAKAKVDSKEFNAAIAEFSLYLEFFPQGKYVPQAHYWMGELYMSLPVPELDNAQKSFESVIKQYPTHAKVPDSLYKLGLLQKQKNNKVVAKQHFERILKEFPQSASASLAKTQLESL